MNQVAASEFDLLSVIRALFDRPEGLGGARQPSLVAGVLKQRRDMSRGLGPTALGLIHDTMAKGLILALVHRGGWRRASSLRGGDVVSGRLWERHGPPLLHLSPFALHLCTWMTAEDLRSLDCATLVHTPATMGDELLLYLAMDLAHEARCGDALAMQPATRGSALCWLGFADVLARHTTGPANVPPADVSVYAFAPWSTGTGSLILEALQPDLTRRWLMMERDKRRLDSAAEIIAIGRIQEAVLDACFAAMDGAERRDLAAFAIAAVDALLAERPDTEAWLPALAHRGPLRVRSDARRAAAILLRCAHTLERWAESAAAVRFFDDEYDAAQLFLRLWERLGDSRYRRAAAIASELESIEGLVS
jgi:hypothetical protein